MSTLTQFETDVNTDEIPVEWPTWDRRTDEPYATPLADLLAASRKPWQLVTLERIVTDAWQLGCDVEREMTPSVGPEKARQIAGLRHSQYINMCLGMIAWAFEGEIR